MSGRRIAIARSLLAVGVALLFAIAARWGDRDAGTEIHRRPEPARVDGQLGLTG